MDVNKAKELETQLKGMILQRWKVQKLINHGKSAAVFEAHDTKTGDLVAIKIFDDELIAKYGDNAQIERIKRELQLVGKSHANMVQILGGGFDDITKNHFLVMGYLAGPNLKDCLLDVPPENVPALIEQLANCCEYLEELGLAHRDIKPENIVLLDDLSRLVLLDFGVVRPMGQSDVTDDDGVQAFVGTLQYSSPEFLLRKEEDTLEGWRALTFYQIGAVIHDLIMRKPIFSDSTQPYARLVNAVQNDTPTVSSSLYPTYLVEAAKFCLSKQPELRAKLLDWSSFRPPEKKANTLAEVRKRVSQRSFSNDAMPDVEPDTAEQMASLLADAISHLKVKVRSIRNANQAAFPPATITAVGETLRVDFFVSETHNLLGNLRISFKASALDAAAGVIRVEAGAHWSSTVSGNPSELEVVHEGLASGDDLISALEMCMYLAMDQAQQVPSDTGSVDIYFGDLGSWAQ